MSKLLGEAAQQSAEPDNASADAVNYHSGILSARAERLLTDLSTAKIIDYPDPADKTVTLGSVIEVVYPGETDTERLLVAGICPTAPAFREGTPFGDDIEVVTCRSPLGRAVLGLTVGGLATYTVDARRMEVDVVGVSQLDPQQLLES